jgi:predicted amidohydrolase YtcJ
MATPNADLVLHDGVVMGHPGSDSVAIAAGRIAAHGRFAELKPLVGPRTHLVRLNGRTVSPGFIDCHLHFMGAASAAAGLQVSKCRTISELLADLRIAAGKTPPGNWIKAFGCDEALLRDGRAPTRAELDSATPRHPLRLRHQTLHASWLNSRAIAALGLERAEFRPPAGAMVQSEAGRLSGLAVGMEQWLSRRLPPVTEAALEARARVFSRELAAAGVTAFIDATVRNGTEEVALFAKLVREGAICQRVGMMIGARELESAPEAIAIARGGGIGILAAKFIENSPDHVPAIAARAAQAFRLGLDCAFHVTEVEELETALAAVEAARPQVAVQAAAETFFRIEHGGLIAPNYLERLAATPDCWVVTNPGFVYYRGDKFAQQPGLVPYIYRAKSLLAAGVSLAAGTDGPVSPARPLPAIAAAVARTTLEGKPLAPEEALKTVEAFALFTRSAAQLARIDAGEISDGKLADLIVLPRDPLKLNAAEIMALQVDLTIVGGRIIYERGRPAVANSDSADLRTA